MLAAQTCSFTRAAYPPSVRLFDRYLLRELLTPLAFCLIGIQAFVTFFILFSDLGKIQAAKLHFWDTIEYSTMAGANFITIVLPVSLLLGLLIALTYHARHNEITALRAAGVSLWRLCIPYLFVGLIASISLFALNEIGVPKSAAWADRILNRYAQKPEDVARRKEIQAFQNGRSQRKWLFTDFNSKKAEFTGVQVNWRNSTNGLICQLNAARAVCTNGIWIFFDVSMKEYAPEGSQLVSSLQTGMLAMPTFDETPAEIENEIQMSKYESLHSRKLNVPLSVLWEYLRRHPNLPPADAANWWTKFDGRLAAPWTCLVVVLIAIPFGVASGRRNLFVGVAGSVFICFTFFVVQQVGLALGTGGYLPPWLAAWLPNMAFAAAGLLLTMRVR